MRYCSVRGVVRPQRLEQVEELLSGLGVVLDPFEESVEQGLDVGTGDVVPFRQTCLGQEAPGLGGLGYPTQQGDRLLRVPPGDQQGRQCRYGERVVGLELQGPPQRFLGAGVGPGLRQQVRLGTRPGPGPPRRPAPRRPDEPR